MSGARLSVWERRWMHGGACGANDYNERGWRSLMLSALDRRCACVLHVWFMRRLSHACSTT